jgi:2-polyprenyl-3-methyl-5-hydroxy-6-metoxy-1,4-benzoquinol methylase
MRRYLPGQYQRVLEVGCGRGGFRNNLSADAEVWGIEIVPEVAEHARTLMNRVLVGSFEDVAGQLPSHYFDLVICNDVIEHMADDSGFLKKLHQYLTADATLVFSVPNMLNWPVLKELIIHKDWRYREDGILDRTHLRFYTRKSFSRLLRETGYEITQIKGINRNVRRLPRLFILLFLPIWYREVIYLQFAFQARQKDFA